MYKSVSGFMTRSQEWINKYQLKIASQKRWKSRTKSFSSPFIGRWSYFPVIIHKVRSYISILSSVMFPTQLPFHSPSRRMGLPCLCAGLWRGFVWSCWGAPGGISFERFEKHLYFLAKMSYPLNQDECFVLATLANLDQKWVILGYFGYHHSKQTAISENCTPSEHLIGYEFQLCFEEKRFRSSFSMVNKKAFSWYLMMFQGFILEFLDSWIWIFATS